MNGQSRPLAAAGLSLFPAMKSLERSFCQSEKLLAHRHLYTLHFELLLLLFNSKVMLSHSSSFISCEHFISYYSLLFKGSTATLVINKVSVQPRWCMVGSLIGRSQWISLLGEGLNFVGEDHPDNSLIRHDQFFFFVAIKTLWNVGQSIWSHSNQY